MCFPPPPCCRSPAPNRWPEEMENISCCAIGTSCFANAGWRQTCERWLRPDQIESIASEKSYGKKPRTTRFKATTSGSESMPDDDVHFLARSDAIMG